MRYKLLQLAALGISLILGASPVAADSPQSARPNFLWISLEDISPDLGCYGDKLAVTPNIDRLSSQGARFTRAFTHAPVCAPSRSGIITGMYPTTIGTSHMRSKGVPPAYVKCFTEYLRAIGYYCTNDSKTDYNFDSPLTAWDDNRRGAHWRNRPRKDQPFFAVINLTTTHESQVRLPAEQQEGRRKTLSAGERHDPEQMVLPPYYPDTPLVRRDLANYYDNLTFTDKQVGKILQQLDEDGLAENTVVFFWGDHGRGMPRHKRWVYDSGIRVPLIIRWPGKIEAGSVRDDLVCFLDLAPTLLSLAGIERPKHLQGQVILGPKRVKERKYIFAFRDRMDETPDTIRAVRDKRFKYIRNYKPELPYAQKIAYMDLMPTMEEWRRLAAEGKLVGPQKIFFEPKKPAEELYDTSADPHEVHNLTADPQFADVLARMRSVQEKWREETHDLGMISEEELLEKMRPGGKWAVTEDPVITLEEGQATIMCATEGASVAYRVGERAEGERGKKKAEGNAAAEHWLLYTGPVAVPPGKMVQALACRLGYKDSQVVSKPAE